MKLPRDLSGTEVARRLARHYGYGVTRTRGQPHDRDPCGGKRPASSDRAAARAGRHAGRDHRRCGGIPRPAQAGSTRHPLRLMKWSPNSSRIRVQGLRGGVARSGAGALGGASSQTRVSPDRGRVNTIEQRFTILGECSRLGDAGGRQPVHPHTRFAATIDSGGIA